MLGKPRIYLFSPTRLINSIIHEHSCKILYVFVIVTDVIIDMEMDVILTYFH